MTLFKALHASKWGYWRTLHKLQEGGKVLLSVADVAMQIENYSLSLCVSKSKDLKMEKVKDNLFHNDGCDVVNKSTVLSKHVEL